MVDDLEAHKQFVVNHQDEFTAARALVDHVQEHTGCARPAALRTVAVALRPKRKARRLAVAARWLAARNDVARFLRREILRQLQLPFAHNTLRVLVDGFHPPRWSLRTTTSSSGRVRRGAVLVSSGWVIIQVAHWYDARCGSLALHRAKRGP